MEKTEANKKFDKLFGDYIKKQRLQRGWTQEQLADKMGNNFQNISRIERGEITPTLFWCFKLAGVFETRISTFLQKFIKKYSAKEGG